jgi:hypothetical protein
MSVDPREVAILTVHGNGPEYGGDYAMAYPWPRLQLDQLRRHTPPGYTVLAYGNDIMPGHEAILRSYPEVELSTSAEPRLRSFPHAWPIRNWLVRKAEQRFRYLVTLDSDAFPVAAGWLDRYIGLLDERHPVVAVQRLENGDTHSDRCFMIFSNEDWRRYHFDFSVMGAKDAGGGISNDLEARGLDWIKLTRSNRWNPHVLTAGIYDRMIYHHAAGSRLPRYRINLALQNDGEQWRREVLLHQGLLDLLFRTPAEFIERLDGRRPPLEKREIVAHGLEVVR